jgi:hypothetical protein
LSNGFCLLFEVDFEGPQFPVWVVFLTPFEAGDGGAMALEELVDEREMRFKTPLRHDVCDGDGGRGNVGDAERGKIMEACAQATHPSVFRRIFDRQVIEYINLETNC